MYCVTTEWIKSLLMKLTVSFYMIKHRENLCNTGKTQGILSWLKCGHPEWRCHQVAHAFVLSWLGISVYTRLEPLYLEVVATLNENAKSKQSILVWCVTPACWPYPVVSGWRVSDQPPPSGCRPLGLRSCMLGSQPPPPLDRQTSVKRLSSRNFVIS